MKGKCDMRFYCIQRLPKIIKKLFIKDLNIKMLKGF